jgi:hypothetical protein
MDNETFENSSTPEERSEASHIPLWLKIACLIGAMTIVSMLIVKYARKYQDRPTAASENQQLLPKYPDNLTTVWPDITIRIDSIARISTSTVIAEWNYVNNNTDFTKAFSWGSGEPNYVALSKLIDGNSQEYPVATGPQGTPLCADTNRFNDPAVSKEIFGGRFLPVWAKFDVPEGVKPPFKLRLHGLTHDGKDAAEVPILTIEDQFARAYLPRQTSWPDIYIKLEGVERSENNALKIYWKYLNTNTKSAFSWGVNQPNFVAATQVYDYTTGVYHNVYSERQGNRLLQSCSSTNKEDGSGLANTIPAGGELKAQAVFQPVEGSNIQIIFHGAMPLFYNPEKDIKVNPLTN